MNVNLPIRKVNVYETRSPEGRRQVLVYTNEGTVSTDLPDEIQNHPDVLNELVKENVAMEGSGVVAVVTNEGVMPQTINFAFPDEIKTVEEAFANFDKYLALEIESYKKEIEKQRNRIHIPTEQDIRNSGF